jgi:competence protein ComEA
MCFLPPLARRALPAGECDVDAGSDWRVIDAEEGGQRPAQPTAHEDGVPRWLIAAIAAVVCATSGFAIWATLPTGGAAVESSAPPFEPRGVADAPRSPGPSLVSGTLAKTTIVVDIEGAVAAPGLHELPEASRVGDAIAAAGGYAGDVDIAAASRTLNLAAKLTDGQQIHVPALGDAASATAPVAPAGGDGSSGPTTAGALIDLNHASSDELDTLPGVGPVTAAKIIDARTEAAFGSVDELQSRGVVGPSTFEKLRDLVTVSP